MKRIIGAFLLALPAPVASTALADDGAREVAPAKVPAAVTRAALKVAPGAKFAKSFEVADKDGRHYYLSGTDAKGRETAVQVSAAGKVERLETEVTLADVPAAVREVAAKSPLKEKFLRVLAVSDDGTATPTEYAFEGLNEKDELMILLSIRPQKPGAAPAQAKAATAPTQAKAAPKRATRTK